MIVLKNKIEIKFLIAECGLAYYNAYSVAVFYNIKDVKALISAILITSYHIFLIIKLYRDLTHKKMLVKDCKNKIKVGDWVRTNASGLNIFDKMGDRTAYIEGEIGEITDKEFYVWQNTHDGDVGKIIPKIKYGFSWNVMFNNNCATIKILNKSLIKPENHMELLEKAALTFKSEPEKSFRKAGITNGDDILTDDGSKVFLSWLLKQKSEQFKSEVVDVLLENDKKE